MPTHGLTLKSRALAYPTMVLRKRHHPGNLDGAARCWNFAAQQGPQTPMHMYTVPAAPGGPGKPASMVAHKQVPITSMSTTEAHAYRLCLIIACLYAATCCQFDIASASDRTPLADAAWSCTDPGLIGQCNDRTGRGQCNCICMACWPEYRSHISIMAPDPGLHGVQVTAQRALTMATREGAETGLSNQSCCAFAPAPISREFCLVV